MARKPAWSWWICRSDLLQAVVPCMASKDEEVRALACGAVRALLANSETAGKVSLEAVQLVADLVRTKKWVPRAFFFFCADIAGGCVREGCARGVPQCLRHRTLINPRRPYSLPFPPAGACARPRW